MLPPTKSGMLPFEVLSALQKYVRRGRELEAMQCALELADTSKAYCTMVLNRLQIISHEDIGIANPQAILLAFTIAEQVKERYDPAKATGWRVMLSNLVLYLCRSEKSREADHFTAVVRFTAGKPVIPDYARDKHTYAGKALGRGLEHFRTEGAKLFPPPLIKDEYEDRAYAAWAAQEKGSSHAEESE
jgi:replication-associated recombination protein RarA